MGPLLRRRMIELIDRLRTALAGRYRIEREVGRGGMAIVFLAHDERHDRAVALKLLRPDLAWSLGVDRFLREIRIAAGLTHPHILPLFDSGEIPPLPGAAPGGTAEGPLLYYVMPYAPGESLRSRLDRERQLPIGEALAIARQAAAALAHAHAQGVVHRDIKPENILLEDGEAVIADFGIARAIEAAAEDRLSEPGLIIGTPAYMSPEQAGGQSLDGRSDVYSLGCVLYEMLVGVPPFQGASARVVLARHAMDTPPPMRIARGTLAPDLEQIVLRTLAKSPADRFQSAADLARALGATTAESEAGPVPSGTRRGRRRRWLVALAVAAVAVVVVGWLLGTAEAEPLDPRRIVLLPLGGPSAAAAPDFALDVGIALDAALNSTPTLRSIRLEDSRDDVPAASRAERAGFALEPRLLAGDSLRLVFTVHDLIGDSAMQRIVTLDRSASAWQAGVRSAARVLPVLIPTGAAWDLSSLELRDPRASAEFLLGERAYRNARFAEAGERFRGALELDSAFTLAAIRGALAALWADDPAVASTLARRALADTASLAPWHAAMARGLAAHTAGDADAAAAAFRRAIRAAGERPEGWMALGEVHTHLLPVVASPDSVAEAAFRMARRVDPEFVPAIPHLIEGAVRRGDTVAAAALLERFEASRPDSFELALERLLVRCARTPLTPEGWRTAVLEDAALVTNAGYLFSVGGLRRPACAEGAWRAVLAHDTTAGAVYHLGALMGLHAVLVATGRPDEARRLLASDTVLAQGNRRDLLMVHESAVERGSLGEGARELAQLHAAGEPQHSIRLWLLGAAYARAGDAVGVRRLADELTVRARAGGRLDSLLAASLRARALAAAGDTAAAIRALGALRPTGDKAVVAWRPWEALAAERLLLAELLLAGGAAERAHEVASTFDAPAPLVNVLYLPESLRLRERAARELGLPVAAREYRARLAALGNRAGPRGD